MDGARDAASMSRVSVSGGREGAREVRYVGGGGGISQVSSLGAAGGIAAWRGIWSVDGKVHRRRGAAKMVGTLGEQDGGLSRVRGRCWGGDTPNIGRLPGRESREY